MSIVLRKVFQNVCYAISVQLIIRIIHIFTISYAASLDSNNAEQIGIVHTRFLLLETIIMLFSKEAIHQVCRKNVLPNENSWKTIMNMLWTVLPICVVLSIPLCWIWISLLDPPPNQHARSYKFGVIVVALSCLLEIIAEAPNFASKTFFFIKIRHTMSLLHAVIFNIIFVIGLKKNPERVIDAFSRAELASSVFWLIGFYVFFHIYLFFNGTEELPFTSIKQFFPSYDLQVPIEMWRQAWRVTGTVLFNHLLQQGDRYVMIATNELSLQHQGIYHLVSALGSLPKRIFIRPLEESYTQYFTHMFQGQQKVRNIKQARRREVSYVIHFSCRTISSVSYMLVVYILCYGSPLLYLHGGTDLASNTAFYLLLAQGLIFCLSALQVMTDSFLFETADPDQIRKYNWILGGVLLLLGLSAWLLSSILGAPGLALATCSCLCMRIVCGLLHMKRVFENSQHDTIGGLIPRKETCIIFAMYLITSLIFKYTITCSEIMQCTVGAVLFVISCYVAIKTDPSLTKIVRLLTEQQAIHQHDN